MIAPSDPIYRRTNLGEEAAVSLASYLSHDALRMLLFVNGISPLSAIEEVAPAVVTPKVIDELVRFELIETISLR